MHNYIAHYSVPVLVVLVILIVASKLYQEGKHFFRVLLVALGFLLGWASAYISLGIFHLYK